MGRYDETVCCCALGRIFGYRPGMVLPMIEAFGSASAIFEAGAEEMDEILGPFSEFKGRIRVEELERSAEELNRLWSQGARFLPVTSPDYPALLKECPDPPAGLYYSAISEPGDIFHGDAFIAVVGTRDISQYGKEWCSRIVRGLSHGGEGPCIVSGLALGTDITAHLTALDSGLKTIAVMATGIDNVYPWRHRGHAARIASTPGCALISDYPPGTAPLQMNFLRRNRIIAGMSRATVLIESKVKGGGMMTAGLASSYGREVYALPGRVDDLRSQGCNDLIRKKIAEPITDIRSFGESLGMNVSYSPARDEPEAFVNSFYSGIQDAGIKEKLVLILSAVRKKRGIDIEEMSIRLAMPFNEVAELANLLESDGVISIDLLQRCTVIVK